MVYGEISPSPHCGKFCPYNEAQKGRHPLRDKKYYKLSEHNILSTILVLTINAYIIYQNTTCEYNACTHNKCIYNTKTRNCNIVYLQFVRRFHHLSKESNIKQPLPLLARGVVQVVRNYTMN